MLQDDRSVYFFIVEIEKEDVTEKKFSKFPQDALENSKVGDYCHLSAWFFHSISFLKKYVCGHTEILTNDSEHFEKAKEMRTNQLQANNLDVPPIQFFILFFSPNKRI